MEKQDIYVMRYAQHIKNSWNELMPKLKSRYECLTDLDLEFTKRNDDQILEVVEKKLGKTRQELIWLLNRL
jgi:hypothetical protein